jgi:hypothetical protein
MAATMVAMIAADDNDNKVDGDGATGDDEGDVVTGAATGYDDDDNDAMGGGV